MRLALLGSAAALVAACGASPTTPSTSTTATVADDPATAITTTSGQSEDTNVTTLSPGGDKVPQIDPGLDPLVAMAVTSLAGDLGVAEAEVAVVAATLVVWPDTSLGCPLPGMEYQQVPQDGSRIVLAHSGATYEYHTGGSRFEPFLCEPGVTSKPPATIEIPPPLRGDETVPPPGYPDLDS
jgi:hypothetical protein